MNNLFELLESGIGTFEDALKEADPKYKQLSNYEKQIIEAATSAVRGATKVYQSLTKGWDEYGSEASLFDHGKKEEIRLKAERYSFGSPLVVAIIEVYQLLVHAKGRTITANDDDLQKVINAYTKLNKNALFSQLQRMELERMLWTDSLLHFIHFQSDDVQDVKTRFVPSRQWQPPIYNPDDRSEIWFHVRNVSRTDVNGEQSERIHIHPDHEYIVDPRYRDDYEMKLNQRNTGTTVKVLWNQPVKRLMINRGVSKLFPILSWVECYERLLNMVATVYAAISAVALVTRTKAEYVKKVAAKLATVKDSANPSGNNLVLEGDVKTLNAKSALLAGNDLDPFLFQISMVVQLPPHAFGRAEPANALSDGQNSNELMRLAIEARQSLHAENERDLIDHAIMQAVRNGDLKTKGKIVQVPHNDGAYSERIEWVEGFDSSYDVSYPPVRTIDLVKQIEARIKAHTLDGKRPNSDISNPKEYYSDVFPLLGRVDIEDRVKELPEAWEQVEGTNEADLVAESRMEQALTGFMEDLRESMETWEHAEAFDTVLQHLREGKNVTLNSSFDAEVYEDGELSETFNLTG